jgi:hypothetical protein
MMMTRIRKAKLIIRLSLLALLILFVSVTCLLFFAKKQTISPGAAKELVEQWQSAGTSSGDELERVLGTPTEAKITNRGKKLSWIFDQDSFFDVRPFVVVVDVDHEDHVFSMITCDMIYAGCGELWKYRWERLKRSLGFN